VFDYIFIGYSHSAPLIGWPEMVPVAEAVLYIPFKELIIGFILFIDMDFIAGGEVNIIFLLYNQLFDNTGFF